MAKSRFDTSFPFGANAPKPGGKKKGKGRKRKQSAAQKAAAALYMKPRRR
jgi:hypothetical protein